MTSDSESQVAKFARVKTGWGSRVASQNQAPLWPERWVRYLPLSPITRVGSLDPDGRCGARSPVKPSSDLPHIPYGRAEPRHSHVPRPAAGTADLGPHLRLYSWHLLPWRENNANLEMEGSRTVVLGGVSRGQWQRKPGLGSPPTQPVKASTVPRSEARMDGWGASVHSGNEACESFPWTGLATLPLPLGN